ncbi:hypothetical protein BH23PSE1_BH23PSE1_18330 [soil metagenome]
MLTLYHAPRSRSSRIVALIDELELAVGAEIEVRTVTIPRQDGSGGRDPVNLEGSIWRVQSGGFCEVAPSTDTVAYAVVRPH